MNQGKVNLVIVTTHPIQYMVPWFRNLEASPNINLTVLYALIPDARQQGTGFGASFEWDVPLLDGYAWQQLRNSANPANLDHHFGSRTPGIGASLKALSPHCVLVTGWNQYSLIQAAVASRKLGIPCLVRGDSNNLRPRSRLKQLLHRQLMKLYSGFLFTGQANRQFYLDYSVDNKRLYFTPHFVDNHYFSSHYQETRRNREAIRRESGYGTDEIVFLYVGKLQAKKHVDDLLTAFELVKAELANARLLIAGDGELRQSLESMPVSRDRAVRFLGFVNQSKLPLVYLTADCLVLPSDYGETWGLVVNEAMNFGLPAIVSDQVGCGVDLVKEGKTGYRYRFGEIEMLADRMRSLGTSKDKLREMGQAALQHVKYYSLERATEGLQRAIIEQVAI